MCCTLLNKVECNCHDGDMTPMLKWIEGFEKKARDIEMEDDTRFVVWLGISGQSSIFLYLLSLADVICASIVFMSVYHYIMCKKS
jgi:hypothetical protein